MSTERERYHKLYPLGRIPLMVLDDGRLIPESSIIGEYLDANLDGGPRLIPPGPDEARQSRFHDS
ncbi:MAG: glutathione S-transferase family protein [Alphaproteobacteria bacterium]|nr:glutathione S-transferase family protein [Alphaproteobacteria bacterium]